MALDTRDYWKQKWNKRSGYKENADFRIGVAEQKRKQYRNAWIRNFQNLGLFFALVSIVVYALKAWFRS